MTLRVSSISSPRGDPKVTRWKMSFNNTIESLSNAMNEFFFLKSVQLEINARIATLKYAGTRYFTNHNITEFNENWRSLGDLINSIMDTPVIDLIQEYITEHLMAANEIIKSVLRKNSNDSEKRTLAIQKQKQMFKEADAAINALPTDCISQNGKIDMDEIARICNVFHALRRALTTVLSPIFTDALIAETEASDKLSRCCTHIENCIIALSPPKQIPERINFYNFWRGGHHASRFTKVLDNCEDTFTRIFVGFQSRPPKHVKKVVEKSLAKTLKPESDKTITIVTDRSDQIRQLIRENAELRERVKELEEEIERLNGLLSKMEDDSEIINRLQLTNKNIEEKYEQSEADNMRLQGIIKVLILRLAGNPSTEKDSKLASEIIRLKEENEEKQIDIDSLTRQLLDERNKHRKAIQKEDGDPQLIEDNMLANQAFQEIEDENRKLQQKNHERKRYKEQIESIMDEVSKLQEELELSKKETSESKKVARKKTKENVALDVQNKSLQKNNSSLKQQIEKLKEDNYEQETQLEELKDVAKTIKSKQKEIVSLNQQKQILQQKLDDLQEQFDKLEKEFGEQEQELEELRQKRLKWKDTKKSLNDEIEELKHIQRDTNNKLKQYSELSKKGEQLDEIIGKLARTKSKKKSLKEENEELKNQVAELQLMMKQYQQESEKYKQMKSKLDIMKQEKRGIKEDLEEAKLEIQKQKQKIIELELQIKQYEQNDTSDLVEKLKKEKKQLKQANDDLEQQLQDLEKKIQELEQNPDLKNKLNKLEQKKIQLQQEITELLEEKTKMTKEINTLKSTNKDLANQLEELKEKNNKLSKTIKEQSNQGKDAKAKLTELENQLNETQQKLEEATNYASQTYEEGQELSVENEKLKSENDILLKQKQTFDEAQIQVEKLWELKKQYGKLTKACKKAGKNDKIITIDGTNMDRVKVMSDIEKIRKKHDKLAQEIGEIASSSVRYDLKVIKAAHESLLQFFADQSDALRELREKYTQLLKIKLALENQIRSLGEKPNPEDHSTDQNKLIQKTQDLTNTLKDLEVQIQMFEELLKVSPKKKATLPDRMDKLYHATTERIEIAFYANQLSK